MNRIAVARELVCIAKLLNSYVWDYKRLPDSKYMGSVVNWHRYENDGNTVDFSYDNGSDEFTAVLVNGRPWGKLYFNHPILHHVDFGGSRPKGLDKVADYVIKQINNDFDDTDLLKLSAVDNSMFDEKLSSLYLKLHTWATKKVTSLPASAPVAVQILDGLDEVNKKLAGKAHLTGKPAVQALLDAMSGTFTMDAAPIPLLVRRYGLQTIREMFDGA